MIKHNFQLYFLAFKWFPYGGLTRDMEKIARVCVAQGYQVSIYVGDVVGELPSDLMVHVLTSSGVSNHAKNSAFEKKVNALIALQKPDVVVGFNRMRGLDVYYAADSCFALKPTLRKTPWLRLLPRYKTFLAQERAVFSSDGQTHILAISKKEVMDYQQHYAFTDDRVTLLPPGINKSYIRPADNAKELRQSKRRVLAIAEQTYVLLFVGSGFKTKGLDRAIALVAELNKQHAKKYCLLVVGLDDFSDYQRQAKRQQVEDIVKYLGPRDDVNELMLCADVLVHPAYRENTGTVLLEAAVAGLPVLTTDTCGYATYISTFKLGCVVSHPYSTQQFVDGVHYIQSVSEDEWQANARILVDQEDVFGLHQQAANKIIELATR